MENNWKSTKDVRTLVRVANVVFAPLDVRWMKEGGTNTTIIGIGERGTLVCDAPLKAVWESLVAVADVSKVGTTPTP